MIKSLADLGHDETRFSNFAAASIWDAARSRANVEFQACHRDRPREPDTGQSFPSLFAIPRLVNYEMDMATLTGFEPVLPP